MNELLRDANSILALLQPVVISELALKRFGSVNDGGYVIVNDLDHHDYLVSFGIGNDMNFEAQVVEKIAGAHLYDDSISLLPTPIQKTVFFPERIDFVQGLSLTHVLSRLINVYDLILKIDIEGSEWDIFDMATSDELIKFRQIVVEFHWLEGIVESNFRLKVLRVLKKIGMTHYVINSHPNNWSDVLFIENVFIPNVIEVTFFRRNENYEVKQRSKIDLENALLNAPCNPEMPEIYLNFPIDETLLNLNVGLLGLFSRTLRDELTQQRDELTQQRDELTQQRDELTQQRDELTQQRDELMNSTIWKLTKPLRDLINCLKK
jgi:hypothetical protein